jgi:hypothetical protein
MSKYFSTGQTLSDLARSEFKELKAALRSSEKEFKWTMAGSATGLLLGIAGRDPYAIGGSVATAWFGGYRYFGSSKKTGLGGFSYLLNAGRKLGAPPHVHV